MKEIRKARENEKKIYLFIFFIASKKMHKQLEMNISNKNWPENF